MTTTNNTPTGTTTTHNNNHIRTSCRIRGTPIMQVCQEKAMQVA